MRIDLVALDLAADARAQDLDRDLAAVAQARAVDLGDRGGGDRLLVEFGEHLGERLAEIVLDARLTLRNENGGSSSWRWRS